MSSDNMYDRDGWEAVGCRESDLIRTEHAARVASSLTDPEGTHGPGVVYTEWAGPEGEPLLRDYRWSDGHPCEHLVPTPTPTDQTKERDQ